LTRTRSPYADGNPVDTFIDQLPAHGTLYQYKSDTELGAPITAVGTLVEDFINLRVVYQNEFPYYGADGFKYHAEDSCGYDSQQGAVTIDVKYFNYPPTCVPCTAWVKEDESVVVSLNATNRDTAFADQTFTIWSNQTDSRLTITGPLTGM
jgi:hypothetical protein